MVRLKASIVDIVCLDGTYNMVAVQQLLKYGRTSAVDFGPVDIAKFAEAFGAAGWLVDKPDEIAPSLKRAFKLDGPVILGVTVDYRDNKKLFEMVGADSFR